MRMQKTDVEFVLFDARDVILTSTGGGTVGSVGYYWISKNGVEIFNKNEQGYKLNPPVILDFESMSIIPKEYDFSKYIVVSGKPTWNSSDSITGSLSATEQQYLITDNEIRNRFGEVIQWLEGTAVRS